MNTETNIIIGSPMNKSSTSILLTICCLLSGIAFSFPALAGSGDRLERPSLALHARTDHSVASNVLLLDIALAGSRLVVVGEQGAVLLSDDAGYSWRQAKVPSSVLLTAVYFVDDQTGWAVGHDGVVLRSEDGGENWHLQLDGEGINQNRITTLEQALAGLDQSSENDGTDKETLEYALEDAQFAAEDGASTPLLDVWFASRDLGYIAGAYGMLLQTRDGGQSWQSMDHLIPNPDRFHLNAIQATADGSLFLAGEAGLLIKRDAKHTAWQVIESPYEGSFFAMQQAQGLYLMGLRGHLFRSDAGTRWQPIKVSTTISINAAVTDQHGQLILLGQGGLLLQQQGSAFVPLAAATRTSFSSGVVLGQQLILVGEAGVTRVQLDAQVTQTTVPSDQGGRS